MMFHDTSGFEMFGVEDHDVAPTSPDGANIDQKPHSVSHPPPGEYLYWCTFKVVYVHISIHLKWYPFILVYI